MERLTIPTHKYPDDPVNIYRGRNMTHYLDYAERMGLSKDTVQNAIYRGTIKAFKWQNTLFVLDEGEDFPPSKIVVYENTATNGTRPRTTLDRLERRVEELEYALKEVQCHISGKGYHLLKPIVGRHTGVNRRLNMTSPNSLRRKTYDNPDRWTGGENIGKKQIYGQRGPDGRFLSKAFKFDFDED